MPLDQADAIVLRTSALGDIDKLAVFLTREKGLVRGVAKGARKFGNRFGSSLEPMSHVKVFYYEKERRELVTISACDLLGSFFDIQKDVRTALTTAYMAELAEEFVPPKTHEDIVFRLLLAVLQALEGRGDPDFLARYFEAWLLHVHGVLPEVKHCPRGGTAPIAATAPRSAARKSAAIWPSSWAGPARIPRRGRPWKASDRPN
jgi:DNA repair protein RecO (recombination protein O)